MDVTRVENSVKIIKHAIENGVSIGIASVKCGFTAPYVKNAKRDIIIAKDRGTVSLKNYNQFMDYYDQYNGTKVSRTETEIKNEIIPTPSSNKKVIGKSVKVEQSGGEMDITWTGDREAFNKEFLGGGQPKDFKATENAYGCCQDETGNEEPEEEFHRGYPKDHIKSLEGLLDRCGVDTDEWEVIDYLVNKWDVTSWKMGYPQTWENFQVKAKVKRIQTIYDAKESAKIFKELIKEYEPPQHTTKAFGEVSNLKFHEENNLLELALYDLHIGKLAWAGETGENFDVKIAMKRFLSILETLLKRANGFSYNRILFPIGNDFFNSDNLHNTTTAGTPQQEDLRWKKTFKMGIKLLIAAIDMLKETGVPVDVIVIPGNHDFERSFYLGSVLEAWFNIDEQVNIDNGAPPRKYYEFGEVLLGLSHGKEEKENALPLLMATEASAAWGRTKFHEWHLGHFHKKRNIKFAVFDKAQVVNEEHSVTVRYLSSLTGTEEWHNKKGYVGTQKAGEAFIWNDTNGMLGHLNANFVDFESEL